MDIVAIVVSKLSAALDVPVHDRVPSSRPVRFVTVQRTGGAGDRYLDRATVAVQAWASTPGSAASLAYDIEEAMLDVADGSPITEAVLETSQEFDLLPERIPRHQLVYRITAHKR